MSDLIEAIACVIWHYPNHSFLSDYDHALELAEDILKRLPSAEPEIIRCKDCKHRFLQNGIWQCPFTIPASENHFCGYAERRTDVTIN